MRPTYALLSPLAFRVTETVAVANRVVQATDYDALETLAKGVVKDKQKFERLEVSKEDLLKMFEVSSVARLVI